LDAGFVKALVEDYDNAPLAPADRVMLDYVSVLTKDATRVTPDHHRRLREAGFDDRAILQITLIAAWFNYITRVADALGVGRGPAEAFRS
jgi:alkylhydroperoxidase family enzyme